MPSVIWRNKKADDLVQTKSEGLWTRRANDISPSSSQMPEK